MVRATGAFRRSDGSSPYEWITTLQTEVKEYPKMNCGRCDKEIDKKAANQKYCIQCSADLNRERSYGSKRKKEV